MSHRLIESTVAVSKPQEDGDRLVLWAIWAEGGTGPETQMEYLSVLRNILERAEAEIAKEAAPDEC